MQEKDRRIELLRGRRKKSKQQPVSDMKLITNILSDHTELVLEPFFFLFQASLTSLSGDLLSATDDDALSVHSDFSEASEMVSSVLCHCLLATCFFSSEMRYYHLCSKLWSKLLFVTVITNIDQAQLSVFSVFVISNQKKFYSPLNLYKSVLPDNCGHINFAINFDQINSCQ